MGCGIPTLFNRKGEQSSKKEVRCIKNFEQPNYDLDIIEVSNLALAIKNKEPTINIEISLACQNLPEVDLFGLTDPMIVCFKKEVMKDTGEVELIEIGRTEIIPNDLNPRFIKTFILSYNEQRIDTIEFQIFDIDQFKNQDLKEHNLIGKVETTIREIVEAGSLVREIDECAKRKGKSYLKVGSTQYDGGNSKYEAVLTAGGLASRHDIFLKLQVYKVTEWMPIYCSEIQENERQVKFDFFSLPVNKFPQEDKTRVRLKVFQFNESKGEIEIGSTDELHLSDLFIKENKQKVITITKDSLPVGIIGVVKFQKILRDSFISYIVNGAKMHLLVAVDFSRPTETMPSTTINEISEESEADRENNYIEAIREVIGILQYFDYYNQMAFYGFGAKLPPYYKTTSHCFALNGNYFNPIVIGGAEELVKVYKQNITKIKKNGFSKLSEIVDLACEFSQGQPKSSDYYVLTVFTQGNIIDQEDLIEKFIKASQLPLSILIIGVGDGEFPLIDKIIDNDEAINQQVRESLSEGLKRDIVHFIHLNKFKRQSGGKDIAKQVFAEIPKQYIEYMKSNNIKVVKKNKLLKNAKAEFINNKINECRKIMSDNSPYVVYQPKFLSARKEELVDQLQMLGFESTNLIDEMKIAMNSINYYIEVESSMKREKQQETRHSVEVFNLREVNRLDELYERRDKINHRKTLMRVEKAEANQYGRRNIREAAEKKASRHEKKEIEHPCLVCGENQITVLHADCGHCCSCRNCYSEMCPVCGIQNTLCINI